MARGREGEGVDTHETQKVQTRVERLPIAAHSPRACPWLKPNHRPDPRACQPAHTCRTSVRLSRTWLTTNC